MNIKIGFYSILLLAVGCQSSNDESFETVDSQESYDMTDWSEEKKATYYSKSGQYFTDYLKVQECKIPSFSHFEETLKSDLNVNVSQKDEVVFLSHFIQKDKENQLVIFPKYRVLSFKSELPLADSSSLAYPHSELFKEVSHKEENTFLINQLLFYPKTLNVDTLLTREWTQDFFQTIVCDYHFSKEEKIFSHVINKLIPGSNDGIENDVYLKLFFHREKPEIDTEFVQKIAQIDHDRKIYDRFILAIQSEYPKRITSLQKEVNRIYGN